MSKKKKQKLKSTSEVDIAELPEREAQALDDADERARLAQVRKLKDEAFRLFQADGKMYSAEKKAHTASDATALECGRAFLAAKAAMKHGEFKEWWSKFSSSANRINYCIRLARITDNKPCKATERKAYRQQMIDLNNSITWLWKWAQDGNSSEALKLLAHINQDLWSFYESNFIQGGRVNKKGKKLKPLMPVDMRMDEPKKSKTAGAAMSASV